VRGETDWRLFDLKQDPGQTNNIAAGSPMWSNNCRRHTISGDKRPAGLVNEDAYKTAPKVNPFKEEYWKQFGGGPNPGTNREQSQGKNTL